MLGDKIRSARKESGMTLTELADKIGVTPGHVSLVERNQLEPSMSVLRKLSEVMGIPVPVLFTESNASGVVVMKKNKRIKLRYGEADMEYELLSPLNKSLKNTPNMSVVSFKLAPKSYGSDEIMFSESDLCIYVTSGLLECRINDTVYAVAESSSIYIVGNTGYILYNPDDDTEVRGLSVSAPAEF